MVYKNEKKFSNIIRISFLQILLFSFLFGSGTIGNPNNQFKKFINANITDKNELFAIQGGIEDKSKRILSFYLRDYINYDLNKFSPNDGTINLFLLKSQLKEISEKKILKYEKVDNYKDIYLIKLNPN